MGKDKRELWSLYLSTVRDMTKKMEGERMWWNG